MRSGNTSTPSICNYDNVIQPYPRARVKSESKYLVFGIFYLVLGGSAEHAGVAVNPVQVPSTKYCCWLAADGCLL
jgi:hypothetical protein